MATGDPSDIAWRLARAAPTQWFPSGAPRLTAQLAGPAAAFSVNYGQIAYAALQTRAASVTDGWADLASQDYLGGTLARRTNEADATFSLRIRLAVLAPKMTRQAIVAAMQSLTGRAPIVFNPTRPADAGGYGTGSLGYGVAGGYGSLLLPYQFFITAFRPILAGVPYVGGYYAGSGWAGGGYGAGALEYATLALAGETVTDAQIYAAINGIIAAGITAWVRILN
jgi:hypothetical protein